MQSFYSSRLKKHQVRMMRFLKYVLNDHFMLVCLIGLGGIAYYYSSYVKTLNQTDILVLPIVLVSWLLFLFLGDLSTLLQDADQIFLLPKETKMVAYFKKARNYSMGLPVVMLGVGVGATMPLLVATTNLSFTHFWYFFGALVLFKWSDISLRLSRLYLDTAKTVKTQRIVWLVLVIVGLVLSAYVFPVAGLIAATLSVVLQTLWTNQVLANHQLDWHKAIELEKKRLKKIYSFFNLFTDVPGLSSEVKRRAYLDPVLHRIKKTSGNTFVYLYSRVFLRGTEYSGLVTRLAVIGALLLFFSGSMWLNLLIGLLFLYLIGFQLLPIYHAFDYMLMTQLYPLDTKQKSRAVSQVVRTLLGSVTLLFGIVTLISYSEIRGALILSGSFILFFVFLSYVYVPSRLKKIEKNLI